MMDHSTPRRRTTSRSRRVLALLVAAVLVLQTPVLAAPPYLPPDTTVRVSVNSAGDEGDWESRDSAISADGRYIAFQSMAFNLAPTNDFEGAEIFLHDLVSGETTRVSVNSAGEEANLESLEPAISADGRFVAFASYATNLVDVDGNGAADIFVHDRVSLETTRVSVSSAGEEGNLESRNPAISADGRYVAFASAADNLVENDYNEANDIFVHDRVSGETTRVSVDSEGMEGAAGSWNPAISADGNHVAFSSGAANLVLHDTNGVVNDIFVRDLENGLTTLVSLGIGEVDLPSDWPSISADGSHVAFESEASTLVDGDNNLARDIFVRDLVSGETTRVSVNSAGAEAVGWSWSASISADDRYVAFTSDATNLVDNDNNDANDIFVRDLVSGETTRVNVNSAGDEAEGDDGSGSPSISADGRYVSFDSWTFNLVENDNNVAGDVFVRRILNAAPVAVSDTYTTSKDNTLTVSAPLGMLANDTDADADPFTLSIVSGPATGTLDGSADGAFIYVPAPGFSGPVTFTYRVSDGFLYSQPATVTITVQAPPSYIRIEGPTRFETAVSVSEEAFPDGLDPAGTRTIIIATGLNWPDALGGTSLAGVLDGSILLVRRNSIPTDVSAEITRLGADKAIIIGGTGAVGTAVETALKARLGSADVTRIGGRNRYETANQLAAEVRRLQGTAWDGRAFVVTGGTFQDAVSAAPLAAANGWPIYLAHPTTGLSPATVSAMQGVTHTIILGGTRAVSSATESGLVSRLGSANVLRLGGSDAYETAVAVANHAVGIGHTWDRVGITTGEEFPDALTGGVLQGKKSSVMLLTTRATLHPAPAAALTANAAAIDTVTFFGGTGAVSQAVRTSVLQITTN